MTPAFPFWEPGGLEDRVACRGDAMKSTMLSLASLVFVLAACGSQDGSPPGAESGQEAVGDSSAVAQNEPENLIGTFIISEGEYVVDSAGEFEIHVVRENGLLSYRIQIRDAAARPDASSGGVASVREGATTIGQKHAAIDPNSNWFIHVESERRYWVFNGASGVTLFEYTGTPKNSEVKMTDLSRASDRLLAEMPDRVKDRIPADALAEKR